MGDQEPTREDSRSHVYAWAKALGIDNWLGTDDFDDLARRLDQSSGSGKTRTEWTWRHNNYVSTSSATNEREEAERFVQRCRTANPGDDVGLMSRTVTDWAAAEPAEEASDLR